MKRLGNIKIKIFIVMAGFLFWPHINVRADAYSNWNDNYKLSEDIYNSDYTQKAPSESYYDQIKELESGSNSSVQARAAGDIGEGEIELGGIDDPLDVPIGDGILPLVIVSIVYFIVKKKKLRNSVHTK